jgi:hypothetical protein
VRGKERLSDQKDRHDARHKHLFLLSKDSCTFGLVRGDLQQPSATGFCLPQRQNGVVGCFPTTLADARDEIDLIDLEVGFEVHLALQSGEILRPFHILDVYGWPRPDERSQISAITPQNAGFRWN